MPRKRSGIWLLILVFCVPGSFLIAHSLGEFALKFFLAQTFARETGCNVSIGDVEIRYSPLRAEARDVSIVHPGERGEEGLRAKRLAVLVDISDLRSKRVRLSRLEVDGMRVKAAGDNSGFFRTLKFILKDRRKKKKTMPWHAFISRGWKIKVGSIVLRTVSDKGLILKFADTELLWQKVAVRFDKVPGKKELTALASAADFSIANNARSYQFGSLLLEGTLGGGGANLAAELAQFALSANTEGSFSPLDLKGAVKLKVEQEEDISFSYVLSRNSFLVPKLSLEAFPLETLLQRLSTLIPEKVGNFLERISESGSRISLRASPEVIFGKGLAGPIDLSVSDISFDGLALSKLSAKAVAAPQRLAIKSIQAQTPFGLLKGSARIDDPFAELRYQAQMSTDLSFSADDLERIKLELGVEGSKERLEFTDAYASYKDEEIRLRGSFDQENGWDARLLGVLNISPLIPDIPGVDLLAGTLGVSLQVKGKEPLADLQGSLRLRKGEFSMPFGSDYLSATEIEIDGELQADDIEFTRLSGRLGGGDLGGNGSCTSILDKVKRVCSAKIDLSKISLEPVENLSLTLGGTLRVLHKLLLPYGVQGDLSISKALYSDTINLEKVLLALVKRIRGGAAKVPVARASSTGTTAAGSIDINISAPDSLLIQTNVATVEMGAKLRVFSEEEELRLSGDINVLDGKFGFGASTFDIINGSLKFDRTYDPNLELVSETLLRTPQGDDTQIQLSISGTLTEPKVRFSSDAGLPEREIVRLLGAGVGPNKLTLVRLEEDPLGSQRSWKEVLNPASSAGVGERISKLTGFSSLELDTRLSSTTRELTPTVRGTRPLVGDLKLTLETELSARQASSARVGYPLTPYLELFSGWKNNPITEDVESSSGSFNLGVRYRRTYPGSGVIPEKDVLLD